MKNFVIVALISFVGSVLCAGDDALIAQHTPKKTKTESVEKKQTNPTPDKAAAKTPVQKKCPRAAQQKKKINTKQKQEPLVTPPTTSIEKNKQVEQKLDTTVLPQKKNETRTIEIKHCISQDMITYHHWTGKHTPEFTISLNDKEIKPDQAAQIPVVDNKLMVNYTFNFAKGYYKDSKKVEISVPEGKKFQLQFSWKQTPNIIICADETIKTQTSTKS
ncbi:MAG: hypothetical protein BWY54_00892 [Candidatus Dependentiae bacterium ADurb.Bin331]|nr:MAG: hypothetical protein BWY54_00892 [Candidatus Dependentiae bacterium ADurb.Bin331]